MIIKLILTGRPKNNLLLSICFLTKTGTQLDKHSVLRYKGDSIQPFVMTIPSLSHHSFQRIIFKVVVLMILTYETEYKVDIKPISAQNKALIFKFLIFLLIFYTSTGLNYGCQNMSTDTTHLIIVSSLPLMEVKS